MPDAACAESNLGTENWLLGEFSDEAGAGGRSLVVSLEQIWRKYGFFVAFFWRKFK